MTNGAHPAPRTKKARRGAVKATPDVRRRLLEGESLTAARVAAEYGCSKSILGQVVARLRSEGYLIDVKRKGAGLATFSCSAQPMGRQRKPKRPKWVEEAEAEEDAELKEPLARQDPPLLARVRCPRLGSVLSKTELLSGGGIRLTIRDGAEEFSALLETQHA